MSLLEKKLASNIANSGFFDFPSLKVQAFHRGVPLVNLAVGKSYTFFDLASITKIIFSTTYFMDAVAHKKVKLTDEVQSFLPWYKFSQVQVGELLNHSAGNHWWEPYYKHLNSDLDSIQCFQQLEKMCQQAPLKKGPRAVYSDIDFFLLGAIMESIENRPLLAIWNTLKDNFYKKTTLHFNVSNKPQYTRASYAPTENSPWRKKIMQGEVHDENAWALGGVAPHAGLFGKIDDLSAFGLLLRNTYLQKKVSYVSTESLKKFAKRSMDTKKGDWGFGFMLPSPQNSSAGDLLSRKAFGHTGFTGTALWYDPDNDLMVAMVSNRVHPTRENQGFIKLRPRIHDWIVQHVRGEK